MNNSSINPSVMLFHSTEGFSIQFTPRNNHLIDGSFKISSNNLYFDFTGLRSIVNTHLQIITFIIDWKKMNKGCIDAQTAFCGCIKLKTCDPTMDLNWALIQRIRNDDEIEFKTLGRSVLYKSKQEFSTQNFNGRKLPFPMALKSVLEGRISNFRS